MKRSDLLKAAPLGLLAACGGGTASSLLAAPKSLLVPAGHRDGKGSCGWENTSVPGRISIALSCASGAWATASLSIEEKFHEVSADADVYWCKNPKTACPFPNHMKAYMPWCVLSGTGECWKYEKNVLQNIWDNFYFASNGKDGGSLYKGDDYKLVAESTIGSFSSGGYPYAVTLNAYSDDESVQTYVVPFDSFYNSSSGSGNRRKRHFDPIKCTIDDLAMVAMFANFAQAVFSAETGIGAVLAIAAFCGFGASVANAKLDGCF